MKRGGYSPKLRGRTLREYGLITAEERAKLIVSQERMEWILRTYPPSETGRPDILCRNAAQPTSIGRDAGPLEQVEDEHYKYWRPKQ